jgi:hypothetical protein
MVVLDKGTYLHGVGYTVFDDGAEGVEGCTWWEGKFFLTIRHAFGADEVERELHAVEEVCKLHPGFPRKRRLGTRTKNEKTHGRRSEFGVLPGVTTTSSWRVEGVSQRYDYVSFGCF